LRGACHCDVSTFDPREDEAIQLLKKHGILPAKYLALVERFGADLICDTVEYGSLQ
jgi:hypothetical protein